MPAKYFENPETNSIGDPGEGVDEMKQQFS